MDIFHYAFIQRALLAGTIIAIICPLIGMFVVVKRQSLLGDGLGHIAFAGVTGGALLQVYPPLSAVALTVAAAVGIEIVRRKKNQYTEMVMALFFYAGLALAIIFSTISKMPSTGLLNFLFGSILTVTTKDIYLILALAVIVMAILFFTYKKLLLTSFDEEIAIVAGINVNRINLLFAILTAIVIVMGMIVVGILLISALMIIPVATAYLWKQSFIKTWLISTLYSLIAVIAGLFSAFSFDFAPGGTIVITAVILYLITFFATELQIYSR